MVDRTVGVSRPYDTPPGGNRAAAGPFPTRPVGLSERISPYPAGYRIEGTGQIGLIGYGGVSGRYRIGRVTSVIGIRPPGGLSYRRIVVWIRM